MTGPPFYCVNEKGNYFAASFFLFPFWVTVCRMNNLIHFYSFSGVSISLMARAALAAASFTWWA